MAHEFRLPDIGEGLTEAEVVRWLVPIGGELTVDQSLVEVETDKAVVEIPSPHAGVLLHQGAAEGEVLEVGKILAVIGETGESWREEAPPIVGTLETEAEHLGTPASEGTGGGVEALPLVRRLAREAGVDLAAVSGTGPGGRVTREDVLAVASGIDRPDLEDRGEFVAGERVRMSKLRRTIAEHMSRSWEEIPHVTTFDSVDGTRLLEAKRALGERHGRNIPLEALVIRAVIPALRAHPELNASLDGEELILHQNYHLGVAVDTPDGLIVPVVAGAAQLSLLDTAAEVDRLSAAAKERSLTPTELSGATFTVSNIGAVGGGFGTPIIPHGTTGILSVGRAEDEPVARNGKVKIAPMIPLSLSYDHRVVDGGTGRRFMSVVIENLEQPALFLA